MSRFFLAILICGISSTAFARASSDLPYSVADSFSTALRFVRIDRGCKVTEKDPDAAYITFECTEDGHVRRGSVEIFHQQVDGHEGARAQVTLGDDPHYMELRFLELLGRKLRDELGSPPALAKKPAPPAPPLDGGTQQP